MRISRKLIALGAIASLGLVATACGDDDSTSTDETTAAAEETATADTTAMTEDTTATADTTAAGEEAAAESIVDIAVGNPDFSTLVELLTAAELVETLSGEGPFTVFAPTDAAFAALPAGAVDDLLKPENKDKLVAVLTYHVLPGEVMSSAIGTQKLTPATVQGATVSVDGSVAGTVKINDATVVTADVDASNGVIHVIDKVIMPPAK